MKRTRRKLKDKHVHYIPDIVWAQFCSRRNALVQQYGGWFKVPYCGTTPVVYFHKDICRLRTACGRVLRQQDGTFQGVPVPSFVHISCPKCRNSQFFQEDYIQREHTNMLPEEWVRRHD